MKNVEPTSNMSVNFVPILGERPDVFDVVGGDGSVAGIFYVINQNATDPGGVFCLAGYAAQQTESTKGE